MSTISASTTSTTAYKVTADTTGTLVFQTGATPTTAISIDASQAVTFAGAVSLSGNQTTTGNLTVNGNTTLGDASTDTVLMTGAPSIGGAGLGMGMGFRNRIINGAMMIDQRNAGASVTITAGTYTIDRWYSDMSAASKYSVVRSSTAPAGFINSMLITSTSAYSVVAGDYFYTFQAIEGLNMSDLNWGTASAQAVTLSFWVRSSLTGTFGGALKNQASTRSYAFTYTINSANTWEQKSITVAGDTTGTWLTTNGVGVYVCFGFGVGSTLSGTAGSWASANYVSATGATSVVGTNGATWYITGVQLEKGSTATAFDYRPYGTELALCQRYFFKMGGNAFSQYGIGDVYSTTNAVEIVNFPVPLRAAGGTFAITNLGNTQLGGVTVTSASADIVSATTASIVVAASTATFVAGQAKRWYDSGSGASSISFSSEL